jgi:predicted GTPase
MGSIGSGKSSLLNTFCGKQDEFTVSSSGESETCETVCKESNWRNSQNQYLFIDTPGLADSKGGDTENIAKMVAALKK